MSRLEWDASGEHIYETGVKNGVLYPMEDGKYPVGVAWNGLTAITESPSGAEATAIYADDIKYLNLYSAEEYGATIEAFTYPDAFAECDGSAVIATGMKIGQQPRKTFGLCYRTTLGNDEKNNAYGYKLHIIYGAMASPSEKAYQTINDSPEAITFSWEITTTPVNVTGHNPTANIEIDSTVAGEANMATIEAILYGCDEFDASKTYAVGAVVFYGEGTAAKTYRCKTAIETAAAWDANKWDKISDVVGPQLLLPDELAALVVAG